MSEVKISDALVKIANEAQQDFFDAHKLSEFFCSGHYHEESMRAALEATIHHLHPQPAELAEQQGGAIKECNRRNCKVETGKVNAECTGCGGTGYRRKCTDLDCAEFGCGGYGKCYVSPKYLAATGKQQVGEVQGESPIDVTDPWRGLYQASRLRAPTEYGDTFHPDIPCWPDDREYALDKLVHAQGFDFHIVAGEFTEAAMDAAMDDGDELYWQEMRAWNPEAPEGEWRLAWKGDTEDGPYAWFVRPMALRPEPAAPPAQGIDLGPVREFIADCAANGNDVHIPTVRSERAIKLLALIDQRDAAPGVE